MVQPVVKMLCSSMSHMPLLFVWKDSGVTQHYGFELEIDVTGVRIPGQRYIPHDERAPEAAAYLQGKDITLAVDLGTGGSGEATMWSCDLSAEYVRINAEYRT